MNLDRDLASTTTDRTDTSATPKTDDGSGAAPRVQGISGGLLQRKIQRRAQQRAETGQASAATAKTDPAVDAALAQSGEGEAHPSGARLHTGATAARAAGALDAAAFTAGSDVFLGAGIERNTPRGDAILRHELAHVEQGRGVAGPEPGAYRVSSSHDPAERAARDGGGGTAEAGTIYRVGLDEYPASVRNQLQLDDSGVTVSGNANNYRSPPAGVRIVLGDGIDAALQGPFEWAVGSLPAATMGLNRTFTLSFDPAAMLTQPQPAGGNNAAPAHAPAPGTYRFSHFQFTASAHGPGAALPQGNIILVERGTARAAAADPSNLEHRRLPATDGDRGEVRYQDVPLAAGTAPPKPGARSTFTVRNHSFFLGSDTWDEQQWNTLYQALLLVPEGYLQRLEGMSFVMDNSGTHVEGGLYVGAGDEPGQRDTVHLMLEAFNVDNTQLRHGNVRTSVQTVLHELGHAVDAIPLDDDPLRNGRRRTRAHSESGHRRNARGEGIEATSDVSHDAFRRACDRDGVTVAPHNSVAGDGTTALAADGAPPPDRLRNGLTSYGNSGWEELYAESFAVYCSDPQLLRTLRPTVFAFFESLEVTEGGRGHRQAHNNPAAVRPPSALDNLLESGGAGSTSFAM